MAGEASTGQRSESPAAERPDPVVQSQRSPRNLSLTVSSTVKALIASPVVILLATATRLIVISNYDTSTATTIASTTGAVSTVLGTVIPLLPAFLPLLFLALVVYRKSIAAFLTGLAMVLVSPAYSTWGEALLYAWNRSVQVITSPRYCYSWVDRNEESLASFPAIWHALAHYGPSALVSDWRVQTVIYVSAGVVLARNAARRWRYSREDRSVTWTSVKFRLLPLWMALVALFMLAFTDKLYQPPTAPNAVPRIMKQPWLPSEKVTLRNGEWWVGYTLSYKDGWHVLLEEQGRTIVFLRADDVRSRTVCRTSDVLKAERPPLIQLGPRLPDGVLDCPKPLERRA
jgi:hypothetical protein